MAPLPSDAEVREEILRRAQSRAPKTLCPSEVARGLAEDWRSLMPLVRAVADQMAASGHLAVTQRGRVVSARAARGPIRLGLPR